MHACSVTNITIDSFDAVEVNTGSIALTLIPELGGKISSLRDLRSGREWLWRHPRMAYQHVSHGSSYVATADTGGWDECFPTVAPCAYPTPPWAGAALQDHGELWSQPAEANIAESAGEITLHTRWHGVVLPYTFERTIRLAAGANQLRLDYSVTNDAAAPIQFIWSAHPLLAIEPGMRLLLPASARFNRWATYPPDLLAQDSGLAYPPAISAGAHSIDLTVLPDASAGVALKLWSDPLVEGRAALHARDGAIEMRWDVGQLPQVAFWMNLGAWAADGGAPYFNLGLEPCIGAQDSLAEAVGKHNLFETLPPHGSREWSLAVELTAQ
jgi:galactose mutarotase-like enzyme